MISVQTVKLLLVFLLASQVSAQELNSTLHSTAYGVSIAYTDEMVVFTCVVRRSNSMAWTSEEYIGTGGQRLELSAAEPVGTRYSAVGNNQTVAELISARIDEIIVSQLHIRIKSNYSIASVLCHNINADTENSTTFLLADVTSIDCDRQSACPDEVVTCTCTTGNSNMLAWMINGSRLEFTSNDPLLTRYNVDGSSPFAVLTNSSDTNGIRVIVSNLTFIASDSTSNIISCENVDRSMTASTIIPISEFSIMTTVESCADPQTTPPTMDEVTGDTCAGPIAAAVVVPSMVIILVAIVIVIIGVIIFWNKYKKLKRETDQQIEKLEGEKRDLNNVLEDEKKMTKTLTGERDTLSNNLTSEQQKTQQLTAKNNQLEASLDTKERTLQNKLRELEQSNQTISSLQKRVEDLNRQLKSGKYRV